MNEKDKILLEDAGIETGGAALEIVDEIANLFPGFQLVWNLCLAYFEVGIKYRTKKVVEWVEMVRNNPDKFSSKLWDEESFQDGFVNSFEDYLRLRVENKRKIARRIFLGFTGSHDRTNFKLEKLNQVLSSISLEGIKYLEFLTEEIFPLIESHVESETERLNNVPNGGSKEKLLEQFRRTEYVSKHLNEWIYENHNPNSPKVKKRCNLDTEDTNAKLDEIWEIETSHKNKANEMFAEYVSLGLFRNIVTASGSIGGGGASADFHVTDFGREFISYIQEN